MRKLISNHLPPRLSEPFASYKVNLSLHFGVRMKGRLGIDGFLSKRSPNRSLEKQIRFDLQSEAPSSIPSCRIKYLNRSQP